MEKNIENERHIYKEETHAKTDFGQNMNIMLMRKMHKMTENILLNTNKKDIFEQNMNKNCCIT